MPFLYRKATFLSKDSFVSNIISKFAAEFNFLNYGEFEPTKSRTC